MVLLKEKCFWLGNVAVPVPDGVYLNADRGIQMDVGIDWIDLNEKYEIEFILLKEAYDAEEAMRRFYEDSTKRHSSIPQKIRTGELSGYLSFHTGQNADYSEAEMAFDVGCAAGFADTEWEIEREGDFVLLYVSVRMEKRSGLAEQLDRGSVRRLLEKVRVGLFASSFGR